MKNIVNHIFILLVCLVPLLSNATTYYVSVNTGNDTFNGRYPNFICCTDGPKKTIQAAINSASMTDTILVAIGIYNEMLIVDKQLVIIGVGSGSNPAVNTILQSSSSGTGTGLLLNSGGFTPSLRMVIKDIRISDYQFGATLNSYTTFENIVVTDCSTYGIYKPNGNVVDVEMNSCTISNNSTGIRISHTVDINGWVIDNCKIDHNQSGLSVFCDNPSTANVKNLHIKNSSITNCLRKGMYIEKLQDALFENLVIDSCGTDTSYDWNAGIDINLKYNNYSNIIFKDCEITNCGIGGSNIAGCGITIKGRDDGSVYGLNPATLDSVEIHGLRINNCYHGFVTGEPGKSNATPTNLVLEECDITNNLGTNLNIHIQSDIKANNNWWGTSNGPVSSDTAMNSTGNIEIINWLKSGTDQDSIVNGFQSDSIVTFNDSLNTLENSIEVTPDSWTLSIPTGNYGNSISIDKSINLSPENFVNIRSLSIDGNGEVVLLNNDLYIEDILRINVGGKMSTIGNVEIELSSNGVLIEDQGDILQGKIRTVRYLNGTPAVEDFGGLGLELTADMTLPFPSNSLTIKRFTGDIAKVTNNNVLRIYEIFAHKQCDWNATLKFSYDSTEIVNVNDENLLTFYRSWDNGVKWKLTEGYKDTGSSSVSLTGISTISSWWTVVDSVGIEEPRTITINHTKNDIKCNGYLDGSITIAVSGGAEPYTFNWSTGDSTATIDSLGAGHYTVMVTDSFGCSKTDTINIMEESLLIINKTKNDVKCFGDSNGNIELNIQGGIPPYAYNWSTGDNSKDINGLSMGIYIIIISDSNNCTSTDTIIITEPNGLELDFIVKDDSNNLCIGEAMALVFEGTPPYFYIWNDSNSQTTHTATGLCQGIYSVSVSDANSCQIDSSIEINNWVSVNYNHILSKINIYPNPSQDGNFVIELNEISDQVGELQIFDALGNLVYTKKINYINTIFLPDKSGIYLLNIILKNGKMLSRKLIVN